MSDHHDPSTNENVDTTQTAPDNTPDATNSEAEKAKQEIQSAQGIVYFIAAATAGYNVFLAFTTSDMTYLIIAGVAAVILGVLGFFSGRNQYVLMAVLTLFVIDTAYTFVDYIQSSSERLYGNPSYVTGAVFVIRFYLIKDMFQGILAFRALRRARRNPDNSEQ
jgi:hypothetical protein